MAKHVSPNDMMEAAKAAMLNGEEPATNDNWIMIVNFFGANMRVEATKLVCNLFDCPLDVPTIEYIVGMQPKARRFLIPVLIYEPGVTPAENTHYRQGG